jgi:hypothetical protein
LHTLAIAAKNYPAGFTTRYTVADGQALLDDLNHLALRKGPAGEPLYEPGKAYPLLLDDKITRDSVRQQIDQLCQDLQDARGDDLLVVYVGGHGVAIDDEYYFVPPVALGQAPAANLAQAALPNLPQTLDADDRVVKESVLEAGVPWSELRRLAQVPCRKLLFLNTCHSGDIAIAEKAQQQAAKSLNAAYAAHMLVVSATQAGQLAVEPANQQNGPFMQCIHDALQGKADGILAETRETAQPKDGVVNLRELVQYLSQELPKRTQGFLNSGPQRPSHAPLELFRWLDVPLAQY